MYNKILLIIFSSTLFLVIAPCLGFAAKIYVSSIRGNDENSGYNIESPLKTLYQINKKKLGQGDTLLFEAGSRFESQLILCGTGSQANPVFVGKYGTGANPVFAAGGNFQSAILIMNSSYIEVSELDVSNWCEPRKPFLTGVFIENQNAGTLNHIYLRNLKVHHVSGGITKSDRGVGIAFEVTDTIIPSRFNDLKIENCTIQHVDRDGIKSRSPFHARSKWFPSTNVVIRGNYIEDVGGDGIIVMACDGALVEHNTVKYARQRAPDHAAGIWPWGSDDTVIQYNEVAFTHGTLDGQGFDVDNNCRNTLVQYNYSHDNDGGFILLCADGTRDRNVSAGNIGAIVRYNISLNDHCRTVQVGGGVQSAKIYNNTFFNTDSLISTVITTYWNGWAEDVAFYNNIFYYTGKTTSGHMSKEDKESGIFRIQPGFEPSVNFFFLNNLYSGRFNPDFDDKRKITTDPMFINAGTIPDGVVVLKDYSLKQSSQAKNTGVLLPNHAPLDFAGNSVDRNVKPSVGAFQ
jgi:hypothetical protein